jgi:hypothetical protein
MLCNMKDEPLVVAFGLALLTLVACPGRSSSGGGGGSGAAGSGASGSAAGTAAGGFDSCSVVTQAEASSALGESTSPGVLGSAVVEGGLACVFYGPSAPPARDPNAPQGDSVRVVVVKGADAAKWFNDWKSKNAAHTKPVTLGDQAFYDGFASLSVLKGSTYVRIAVAPAREPPSLQAEEKLASAILPKL